MNCKMLRITMSLWLPLVACNVMAQDPNCAVILHGAEFFPQGDVARMNVVTVGATETVRDFVELGEEPTKYSAILNETCHFLTASVYEQIAALEERGDKRDAAALAQSAYVTAATERANSVKQAAGLLERAWDAIAKPDVDSAATWSAAEVADLIEKAWSFASSAAVGAWDGMLGVGRPTGLDQKVAEIDAQIVKAQSLLATNRTDFNRPAIIAQLTRLQSQRGFAFAGAINAANVAKALRDAQAYEDEGVISLENLGKLYAYDASSTGKRAAALAQFHAEVKRHDRDNPDSPYDAGKVAAGEKIIRDKFQDAETTTGKAQNVALLTPGSSLNFILGRIVQKRFIGDAQ